MDPVYCETITMVINDNSNNNKITMILIVLNSNNQKVYLASRDQVCATQGRSLQTGLSRVSWV